MTAITNRYGTFPTTVAIAALCLVGSIASSSSSAENGSAGIKRRLDPQYPDLQLAPEEPAAVEEVLPPVPVETDTPSVSSVHRVFVQSVVVEGNTLLSEQTIRDIVSPYEGREISVAELHQVRYSLSQAYYDAGYVNSGVVIPDQQVEGGKIRLQVVEGVLSEVNLTGNDRLRESYITGRVSPAVGEILDEHAMRQSLRLLQLNPLIEQVNARLLPGEVPGEAVLDMAVRESKPYAVTIGVDNYRSPSVGAEHAYLHGVHRNLTGRGDQLYGEIGITDGLDEIDVGYQVPITANDVQLGVSYERTDSEVVENPFDNLDIESESHSIGAYLSYPFYRDFTSELSGLAGFDVRHSESELLGEPYSFSPGVDNGESDVSVVWAGLEWVRRGADHALAIRGTYRQGIDVLDATDNDSGPDGEFSLLLMQFQYLQRLDFLGMQVMARSTMQRSFDPLLPIEKFGVGGRYSVRGYRENQFVRDNGVAATLEGQIPLFQDKNSRSHYGLTLSGFADYGRTWDEDNDLPTSSSTNISSAGISLIWEPTGNLAAELSWAYAFDDVNTPDDDLQDDGVHFSIRYRMR